MSLDIQFHVNVNNSPEQRVSSTPINIPRTKRNRARIKMNHCYLYIHRDERLGDISKKKMFKNKKNLCIHICALSIDYELTKESRAVAKQGSSWQQS